jgi:serine/threonine protein kinase
MTKVCISCCKENNATAKACGFCLAPFSTTSTPAPNTPISVIKTLATKQAVVQNNAKISEVEATLKNMTITSILSQKEDSTVYLAENILSKGKFAIKVLRPSNTEEKQRFLRLATALEKLQHPGTPKAYQYGTMPSGRVFMVSDYIQGQSLRAYVKEKRIISATKAVAIGAQILVALDAVHRAGVLHRNLRPEHIYLRDFQGQKVVTLLGFGANQNPESFEYLSPEQAANEKSDQRADLYSFGVVLFEMLTTRLPFLAKSADELLTMQRDEVTAPPSAFAKNLPNGLDLLVLSCLEKHRDDRPLNASVLKDKLLQTVPTGPLTPSAKAQAPLASKSAPRWMFAAITVGILLVGLLGFFFAR